MKDELTGFADRLKRLRRGAGLTQAQLAQQLGIKASTISAYETGARYPSFPILVEISRIFYTSTDFLLGVKNDTVVDFSNVPEHLQKAIIGMIKSLPPS